MWTPGTFRNQFSVVCECCAANPSPAPDAIRIVTGTSACPAGHVPILRDLVRHLVEGHAGEVREHQLGDGAEPRHRCPQRRTDDRLLGDRRVTNTVTAEPLEQPVGRLEHAARGADVLAQAQHIGVVVHRVGESGCDRPRGR